MKIAALEEFLQDQKHAGSESLEVLEKFLLYAKLVQDPLNVFRYMEEKAICIYFPLFWYSKSEYLAEIGDYRNAFFCLKESEGRKDIEENDEGVKILNTAIKAQIYKDQISQEMLRYPPNKRRTVSDFNIMTNRYEDLPGSEDQKNEQLFTLLETKFPVLRKSKQKVFQQKNESKPKSWLYETYEKEQLFAFEAVSSDLHKTTSIDDNSLSYKSIIKKPSLQSQERLFRSVNTPFKRRDPMMMSKTLDSVEMMKRKRISESSKISKRIYDDESNQLEEKPDQDDSQNEGAQISMNTVPVGRAFEKKKRQVKFNLDNQSEKSLKIEKPRDNHHIPKQDDVIQISRKTTVQKGILRNKSVQKKQLKQSTFPAINERSLKFKQTEETNGETQI